jgi:hypothetical protein
MLDEELDDRFVTELTLVQQKVESMDKMKVLMKEELLDETRSLEQKSG